MFFVYLPLLLVLVGTIGFILYLTVTEYKPEKVEDADKIRYSRDEELSDNMTITTFNLGYCSLDKDQDFFLEGGSGSRTISKERTFDNLISLTHTLQEFDSDFYFLQEVDTHGSRSANINQLEHIASEMNKHNITFAYNYRAKWVPIPVFHPMGSAFSGMVTLSKKSILSSKRISLEGQESYPKSLFYLKRCMTVTELQIKRTKKMYLINIHLSAYDKEGMFRSKQIQHILRYIKELYNPKENYVIVGGDFNLLLDKKRYTEDMPEWVGVLPDEIYESEFRVIFDKNVNTVRSEDRPYNKGINFETIIDGFLVSPNITVSKIEAHDLGYEHTDHNPVTLTFKLK